MSSVLKGFEEVAASLDARSPSKVDVPRLCSFLQNVRTQAFQKTQYVQMEELLKRLESFPHPETLLREDFIEALAKLYDELVTADFNKPEAISINLYLLFVLEDLSEFNPQGKILCGKHFITRLVALLSAKQDSLQLHRASAETLCALVTRCAANQKFLALHSSGCDKLFKAFLPKCGDFLLQASVSEILFRLCRKHRELLDLIEQDGAKRAMQKMLEMRRPSLIAEIRNFVGLMNESMGTSRSVRSFRVLEAVIDDGRQPLLEIWLHFGSDHISCCGLSQNEERTKTMDLYFRDIKEIKRESSALKLVMLNMKSKDVTDQRRTIRFLFSPEDLSGAYECCMSKIRLFNSPKTQGLKSSGKSSIGIPMPLPKAGDIPRGLAESLYGGSLSRNPASNTPAEQVVVPDKEHVNQLRNKLMSIFETMVKKPSKGTENASMRRNGGTPHNEGIGNWIGESTPTPIGAKMRNAFADSTNRTTNRNNEGTDNYNGSHKVKEVTPRRELKEDQRRLTGQHTDTKKGSSQRMLDHDNNPRIVPSAEHVEETETEKLAHTKKRGRPRKTKVHSKEQTNTSEESEKRVQANMKRGRPRKIDEKALFTDKVEDVRSEKISVLRRNSSKSRRLIMNDNVAEVVKIRRSPRFTKQAMTNHMAPNSDVTPVPVVENHDEVGEAIINNASNRTAEELSKEHRKANKSEVAGKSDREPIGDETTVPVVEKREEVGEAIITDVSNPTESEELAKEHHKADKSEVAERESISKVDVEELVDYDMDKNIDVLSNAEKFQKCGDTITNSALNPLTSESLGKEHKQELGHLDKAKAVQEAVSIPDNERIINNVCDTTELEALKLRRIPGRKEAKANEETGRSSEAVQCSKFTKFGIGLTHLPDVEELKGHNEVEDSTINNASSSQNLAKEQQKDLRELDNPLMYNKAKAVKELVKDPGISDDEPNINKSDVEELMDPFSSDANVDKAFNHSDLDMDFLRRKRYRKRHHTKETPVEGATVDNLRDRSSKRWRKRHAVEVMNLARGSEEDSTMDFNLIQSSRRRRRQRFTEVDNIGDPEMSAVRPEALSKRRRLNTSRDRDENPGEPIGFVGEDATIDSFVLLFVSLLKNFKQKLRSRVRAKTDYILNSTSELVKKEVNTVEMRIQKDIEGYSQYCKGKFGPIELELLEQTKKLKEMFQGFHKEFKQQCEHLDQLEARLDSTEEELKSLSDKQKLTHRKLIAGMQKTVEERLSEAESKILAVQKAAKRMNGLREVLEQLTSEV